MPTGETDTLTTDKFTTGRLQTGASLPGSKQRVTGAQVMTRNRADAKCEDAHALPVKGNAKAKEWLIRNQQQA